MLFKVHIETPEKTHSIEYDSIVKCLKDKTLEALFVGGYVSDCLILDSYGKRISGLPVMKWDRFKAQVKSSSPCILKEL